MCMLYWSSFNICQKPGNKSLLKTWALHFTEECWKYNVQSVFYRTMLGKKCTMKMNNQNVLEKLTCKKCVMKTSQSGRNHFVTSLWGVKHWLIVVMTRKSNEIRGGSKRGFLTWDGKYQPINFYSFGG